MATERRLTDEGVMVKLLRSLRAWKQGELATAARTSQKLISSYELGEKVPRRSTLKRLAAAVGIPFSWVERTLPLLHLALAAIENPSAEGAAPPDSSEAAGRIARALEAEVEAAIVSVFSEAPAAGSRAPAVLSPEEARREAAELWEHLKDLPARNRSVLVEGAREYRSWALCERLCAESERAAPADTAQAVELAELALRVAALVPGDEAWRSRLQGYAWVHLGNARRAAGHLPRAEAAFANGLPLWEAGAGGDPGLLSEGQVLDLEASLRRDQRRFGEALDLHDRALAVTQPADQGFILLNKAFTLEQKGESEQAIEILRQAALRVDPQNKPRLWWALRFNLAVNLCHLGRHAEAETLMPELRGLAAQLGNEVDLLRVLWLEGRIAAHSGRPDEALGALTRVREEFITLENSYDAALVTIEIAALHLEQGRIGAVKALARQMAPIFQAQGVHREALAALQLFFRAAERETATVEMARRLIEYLHRARHDPKLRFQGE